MSATETKERLSREFWAIDDFWNIVRVKGYECPPNDKVWWVPSLGYSMTEGHHLFDVFDEAQDKALLELSSKISELKTAYNRLRDMKDSPNEPES